MGSIFQVMYMSLGLTAHQGFSWQKVLAKFRNKIGQKQNEAQYKLQNSLIHVMGMQIGPLWQVQTSNS
jgi:hypothetical protein